jgi:uncharacterized LabA/DUF88 family protein
MDLQELKKQFVCGELKITLEHGIIFSFVDFSNVNKWFENDDQDWNSRLIAHDEKLKIDIQKLKVFVDIFSKRTRIYYGEDPKNAGSLGFTYVMRKIFGKRDVVTKDLQKIKHYIKLNENDFSERIVADEDGKNYIEIRKCNFDVEISVDAIKMINHYDTFCIFSGDADFVYLNNFLRKKGKKVIIIKGGYITTKLRESADLVVNAQNIKKYIIKIEKTRT